MLSENIIIAIVAAVSSGMGALLTMIATRQRNRMERPKIEAEAALSRALATDSRSEAAAEIQVAALALLQPYKEEVERLRQEVSDLRDQVSALRSELQDVKSERDIVIGGAHQLYHQVVSLGGQPVYRPPERRGQACDLCSPNGAEPKTS